jgi:peroxiredoxin/mono/diheme cytochrome c family protein
MRQPALFGMPLLLLLPLVAVSDGGSKTDTPKPAGSVGKTVANFTLKDTANQEWSLADCKDKKAVVVVFIGTECPVNNAYMARLVELHKSYAEKGVTFVGINANTQDTVTRVAAHAKDNKLPFPVLKDTANVVADQFGAQRTPEAFVLDAKGKVVYQGRIDDQYGIGFKRPSATRADLADALEQLLDGKEVTVSKTDVAGCYITRANKPKETGSVTYTKQVSRIMQKNCQECHRPEQVGPMQFMTYEDALNWSDSIQEVVKQKRMPPWLADPAHGKFTNDRSLSAEDRETLLSWIDQGCPKGDPKDLPAEREYSKGWIIGKPDVVFDMPEEFKVPAKAGKDGIRYQIFAVPTNYDEDRWIQAVEARPGAREVVHHIIVYVAEKGKRPGQGRDGIGNGFLVGYAPGDMPAVFTPGTAKKLPKGGTLVFQMHYTPDGVERTDRSQVALIFAKEPPKIEVKTRAIAQQALVILPGANNYEAKSVSKFDDDVDLYSLLPHMHLRGKDFIYKAVYPDGKTETLLSVPRWDFNWQSNYRLAKPLRLPAGTKIECTAHFDNSSDNPNNPNPKSLVHWGEQTWDEMMIGFVDYAPAPKEEKK